MFKRLSLFVFFVLICQTSAASATPPTSNLMELVNEMVGDNFPYADGVILVKLAEGSDINHITADYGTETNGVGLTERNIYLLDVPSQFPSNCGEDPTIPGNVNADEVVEEVELEDVIDLAMEYLFAACLYLDDRVVVAHPNYVEDTFEGNPRGAYTWDGDASEGQKEQYALTLHNYNNVPQSEGVNSVVAVLDTGVDGTHPYLEGYVLPGYDVIEDDGKAVDEQSIVDADADGTLNEAWGHGTHVAGIIHTVAPQAKILPVRVLNADGHGTVYDVALGIQYALAEDVDVINLSLSGRYRSPILEELLESIADQDVLLVASAGNAEDSDVRYPAGYDNVIAVAAIDENSQKTASSNYGDWITVAAAGSAIRSSVPEGDGFAYWSGTSMAAPFVSGIAAIAYSVDKSATAEIITEVINDTSSNIDDVNPSYGGELGAGRLNMNAVIRTFQTRAMLSD